MANGGISYDPRGNLTGDSQYTYQYDALDRLIAVTPRTPGVDSIKTTYTYDVDGIRSGKTVSSGWDESSQTYLNVQSTKYVYDLNELVAEVDAITGKMVKSYSWHPNADVGVGGHLSSPTSGLESGPVLAAMRY